MLLNHTIGIDADVFMPSAVRKRDAARSYEQALTRVGTVFEPGSGVHYSNPGFVLAARVVEEITGLPFERSLEQEVFGPCGMRTATALQTQALLRRTAVGAFPNPDGTFRATPLFTLPESLGAAGALPIVTVDDMIAFGRTQLQSGLSPTGERVLSAQSVALMQTPSFDLGIPQAPPIGLGWWRLSVAGTDVFCHGGGSPGGSSSLCIIPEYDALVVSFASGTIGPSFHDPLLEAVLQTLTNRHIDLAFELGVGQVDTAALVGTYVGSQTQVTVEVARATSLLTRNMTSMLSTAD